MNSKVKSPRRLLPVMACMLLLTGCGLIHEPDSEGCEPTYRVRFRYDRNMKFADAFAAEVEEVTLHLTDPDGSLVWSKTESGSRLAQEGYAMEVDAPPGRYTLVAWCSSAQPSTFSAWSDGTHDGLQVHFGTERHPDGTEHIAHKLDRLYHGRETDVEFPDTDGGEYIYTIPLTKDTNHLVITLQQLSGEPIDHSLVQFEITDDNAHLAADNAPLTGSPLTYHQWYSQTVSADISTGQLPAAGIPSLIGTRGADNSKFAGVVAELTTSRLMAGSNARLHVYRTDTGATIASVRLIDALLLVMGVDNSRRLTPQQYLDYKDEYNMTFFLDENHRWLNGLLQIESWRVVYADQEV